MFWTFSFKLFFGEAMKRKKAPSFHRYTCSIESLVCVQTGQSISLIRHSPAISMAWFVLNPQSNKNHRHWDGLPFWFNSIIHLVASSIFRLWMFRRNFVIVVGPAFNELYANHVAKTWSFVVAPSFSKQMICFLSKFGQRMKRFFECNSKSFSISKSAQSLICTPSRSQ